MPSLSLLSPCGRLFDVEALSKFPNTDVFFAVLLPGDEVRSGGVRRVNDCIGVVGTFVTMGIVGEDGESVVVGGAGAGIPCVEARLKNGIDVGVNRLCVEFFLLGLLGAGRGAESVVAELSACCPPALDAVPGRLSFSGDCCLPEASRWGVNAGEPLGECGCNRDDVEGDEIKRSTDDENLLESFWLVEAFEVDARIILARLCALLESVRERGERGDNGPGECSLEEDGKRRFMPVKLHFLLGVRGAGAIAAAGAGGAMGASWLAEVTAVGLWGDDVSIAGTMIVRSGSSCTGAEGKF